MRSSRHAAYVVHGLVAIAAAVLWRALLTEDFSLEYVASYSSTTLPLPYTIAALWGGQQGSLLFWVLILTTMSTLVHLQNRERNQALMPYVTATLMTIAVFFLGAPRLHHRSFRALADRGARGRRVEPAAPELLDDDPPALALSRLRRLLGAVRLRDRRARDAAASATCGSAPRGAGRSSRGSSSRSATCSAPAGPTRSSAGAATGRGTRSRTPRSCRGSRAPRSCTR